MKRVSEIFSTGTVQEKHQQISLFFADGHSLLYSGDIRWKLTIPALDQVHRGVAESIDHALPEIQSLLEGAMQSLNPTTKVHLVVETNDN